MWIILKSNSQFESCDHEKNIYISHSSAIPSLIRWMLSFFLSYWNNMVSLALFPLYVCMSPTVYNAIYQNDVLRELSGVIFILFCCFFSFFGTYRSGCGCITCIAEFLWFLKMIIANVKWVLVVEPSILNLINRSHLQIVAKSGAFIHAKTLQ